MIDHWVRRLHGDGAPLHEVGGKAAGLFLASRILERASEIGVRKAFGASSLTLVGQFLVESVILTLLGSLFGLLLSALALVWLGNLDLIPYAHLSLNLKVIVYAIGLALVFSFVSGAYPAWRMSRLHPVEALHGRSA